MAFHARHRWMIQRLNEGFGIHDEHFVESALLKGHEIEKINAFFKKGGPSKLIYFYQAPLNGSVCLVSSCLVLSFVLGFYSHGVGFGFSG
jgi:hypothetical protein